jgi:hypothetical protein
MSLTMLKISRTEWRWMLSWSFFTLGLAALPFIWGWLATPPGHEFTGFLFNAHDGNTYLAKMEQGRQGQWVFHLSYTSETGGNGAVTFTFYLLLGKLAGLLNLPDIIVFHAARLLCGLLLLIVSYAFIALLFHQQDRRRWAFVLVCFAAGFGWILAPLGQLPPDFWVAEGYTFLSIFANPHFPLATALLLIALIWGLLGLESRQKAAAGGWRYYAGAAVISFILGFVHPFMLFSLAGVLGLFWLRLALARRSPDWPGFFTLIGVGLAGLPGPFLTWIGTENDPLLKAWMRQNQTITLDPITTLLGYSFLVPLALVGVWWVERLLPKFIMQDSSLSPEDGQQRLLRWQLVTGWLLVTVVLILLPVSFSRRFLEGIHLPLCCLAVAGWYDVIVPRLARRWRQPLRRSLTTVMSLSSVGMVILTIAFLFMPDTDIYEPVRSPYLSAGELGAFDWLRHHATTGDVVLSGPLLSNVLPGRAPVRVFYGHSMETLNPEQKLDILRQFSDVNTSMTTRYAIISQWNLKYLVYGWRERKLGDFDPSTGGWPQVYNYDNVQIYQLFK